jgi:hypothetical protein
VNTTEQQQQQQQQKQQQQQDWPQVPGLELGTILVSGKVPVRHFLLQISSVPIATRS